MDTGSAVIMVAAGAAGAAAMAGGLRHDGANLAKPVQRLEVALDAPPA